MSRPRPVYPGAAAPLRHLFLRLLSANAGVHRTLLLASATTYPPTTTNTPRVGGHRGSCPLVPGQRLGATRPFVGCHLPFRDLEGWAGCRGGRACALDSARGRRGRLGPRRRRLGVGQPSALRGEPPGQAFTASSPTVPSLPTDRRQRPGRSPRGVRPLLRGRPTSVGCEPRLRPQHTTPRASSPRVRRRSAALRSLSTRTSLVRRGTSSRATGDFVLFHRGLRLVPSTLYPETPTPLSGGTHPFGRRYPPLRPEPSLPCPKPSPFALEARVWPELALSRPRRPRRRQPARLRASHRYSRVLAADDACR